MNLPFNRVDAAVCAVVVNISTHASQLFVDTSFVATASFSAVLECVDQVDQGVPKKAVLPQNPLQLLTAYEILESIATRCCAKAGHMNQGCAKFTV